jgi:tetratricopeptide (TPR) repeat protein
MALGWIDLAAGKFREAIPLLEKAATMGAPPFVTAYLAYAHGVAGDRQAAMADLEVLRKLSLDGQVLPFNLAMFYLGQGDHARALDNLEGALAGNSQMLPWLGQDAIFDSLRSEPRFKVLLQKLNFIE